MLRFTSNRVSDMTARSYSTLRYVKGNPGRLTAPEKVIQTAIKPLRDGLR